MFCQERSHIASQTADQLTLCFRSTFLLSHKLATAYDIVMTVEGDEWSLLLVVLKQSPELGQEHPSSVGQEFYHVYELASTVRSGLR